MWSRHNRTADHQSQSRTMSYDIVYVEHEIGSGPEKQCRQFHHLCIENSNKIKSMPQWVELNSPTYLGLSTNSLIFFLVNERNMWSSLACLLFWGLDGFLCLCEACLHHFRQKRTCTKVSKWSTKNATYKTLSAPLMKRTKKTQSNRVQEWSLCSGGWACCHW